MHELMEKEEKRIEVLKSYAILDSGSENEFDEITALAAEIADAPIAIISFIDEKRQWVKSSFGIKISEIPRENSFCSITINSIEKPLIINDALTDPRFIKTPYKLNNELVAFYIGIPLLDSNKIALGTLSIVDFKSREISSKDIKSLQTIAKGVLRLLELRKTQENSILELEKINKALEINNPFYLILNSNFEIKAIGKSFKKANPALAIQKKITDFFTLEFDINTAIESSIAGKSRVLFFSSTNKDQRYKCSVSNINNDIIVAAQPILNEILPIKNYNITLNDFSQHDSIIEYLFLQQSAQKSLNESRSLMDTATKRNSELEEQKKQIEQNQELLRENLLNSATAKEKYSNIVHATNDLILTIDKTGTILFVNNSWLKKMDYREAEVIGKSIFKHVHPDSLEHCALFFQDLMSNSPQQLDVSYSLINRHGEKIEIEGTIICKYDQNEFIEGNSFLKDVTEINKLKRIEEEKTKEILKSKEKLEVLINSLTETVWGVSLPDYKNQYLSNSVLDLYGISAKNWLKNPYSWIEIIHPDDAERVLIENSTLFSDGFSELEYRIVTPKNEVKWIQTRTKIIKNGDGIPYLMTGIAIDISKRKKLELELIDYKKGIDSAAIVSITDEKGNIIYANDKFCEISKYSIDELIGQNHNILNSGYHTKEFFQEMWQTISSGRIWKGEVKNKAKDGSEYYVESSIIPFMKEGKPYQYLSIRYDSTEKVLNKLELETQKQFYEFILNNLPADLAVFSPDHKYLFINPAGIKNNEIRNFMIGKDDFDYCQLKGIDTKLAVERRSKFNELIREKKFIEWEDVKILENGAQQNILRKIGPIYDEHGDLKMVIGYGIEITERKIAEDNAIKAKKEVEAINLNLKKLVSEETKKNLKLSKSLTENEKMATVGELASGIAHDLNTPLSSIRNGSEAANFTVNSILQELIWKCTREQLNFAIQRASSKTEPFIFTSGLELMRLSKNFSVYLSGKFKNFPHVEIKEISSAFVRARIDINEEELIDQIMNSSNSLSFLKLIENLQTYQAFVNSIEISANRALNVVNDLRLNIKNQNSTKSHVNLNENLSSVLNIFNFELEEKVKVDINIADSIVIYGYDIKLFQLWSNIIKNALEAMESNTGEKLLKISASETKDTISVSIKNNGPAIPIENQQKIFDKFYSTKTGISSSGLGMSIVKNIISDHGAKILLESTDLFTTFTINFKKV
jgi:PAS domain S-box-containing protein